MYTHLHRLADGPTLPVLDILAALLGHVLALLPGHLLVGGLLLLSAVLDRLLGALLGAHSFVNSLLHVTTALMRNATAVLLLRGLKLRLLNSGYGAFEKPKLKT